MGRDGHCMPCVWPCALFGRDRLLQADPGIYRLPVSWCCGHGVCLVFFLLSFIKDSKKEGQGRTGTGTFWNIDILCEDRHFSVLQVGTTCLAVYNTCLPCLMPSTWHETLPFMPACTTTCPSYHPVSHFSFQKLCFPYFTCVLQFYIYASQQVAIDSAQRQLPSRKEHFSPRRQKAFGRNVACNMPVLSLENLLFS